MNGFRAVSPRSVSLRSVALLGLVPLTAGFISMGQGDAQPQRGCTHTITQAEDVHATLAAAMPGDTLCFTGTDLATADLALTRSGTADAPIRLLSDGRSSVHELRIIADHVLIQGFTIGGGGELLLAGTGITAQKNRVHNSQRGGIVCAVCIDSTIEANTVQDVATAGISISGQRIMVRRNLVLGAISGADGSADGVRFFGSGHRILSNTIRDIPASGRPPVSQPACFHTFDTGRPATFDIEIVGNACHNVDEHCLIAIGDEGGNAEAPAGSRSIRFIGNACDTNGDQAVKLRRWPNVDLHKNQFFGSSLKRGILISNASTGCSVRSNTAPDGVPLVEIDDTSRPGFRDQDKSTF